LVILAQDSLIIQWRPYFCVCIWL